MENSLLMDAVERFLRNEMSAEELAYFQELRKNNPDVDQMVVEQSFFLKQVERHGDVKRFKHLLNEVEHKLEQDAFITRKQEKTGKLVTLWNKHKRTFAVAASIAGIVSLLMASLISSLTPQKTQNITPLVQKINEQEKKTRVIENKLNQLEANGTANAVPVENNLIASFRATGFIVDADNNYIATNAHVIQQAKNNLIIEDHKGRQYKAKPVYTDIPSDLAIIKIVDTGFDQLEKIPYAIKRSDVDLGDQVYMLGFPKQEIVYGEGYISAKNGYDMDTIFCQLNTNANEGSSGSPVINSKGDLIGIISGKQTNAAGVVYAIKPGNILRAIDEVKKIPGNEDIRINSSAAFKGMNRVGQIRKLQDYVFMIKGN